MTRKDFERVAHAVRNLPDTEENSREVVALAMADALRPTNPKFDYFRFIEACGITPR